MDVLMAATVTNLKDSFSFLDILIMQKKVLKVSVMFFIMCLQGCHTGVLLEFSVFSDENQKIHLAVALFIFRSPGTSERSLVSSPEFSWEGTWTLEKEVVTYSGFLRKPVTEIEPLSPEF